jgi:hypothetical protein
MARAMKVPGLLLPLVVVLSMLLAAYVPWRYCWQPGQTERWLDANQNRGIREFLLENAVVSDLGRERAIKPTNDAERALAVYHAWAQYLEILHRGLNGSTCTKMGA